MSNTSIYLTATEAAAHLNISRDTVYRLARTKAIPVFVIGGSYRFTRDSLDAWMAQQLQSVMPVSHKMPPPAPSHIPEKRRSTPGKKAPVAYPPPVRPGYVPITPIAPDVPSPPYPLSPRRGGV